MLDDQEAMFDDQEAMCVPMHFKVTATARFGCDNNNFNNPIAPSVINKCCFKI